MGVQIELKATGEKIEFNKRLDENGNEVLETLVTLPAGSDGPPPHRHVLQTELFEAISGTVGLNCQGEKIFLQPGETYLVPCDTVHQFFSPNGDEIQLKAVFTPAMHTQYILTEIFNSCNRKNSKNPSVFDATFVLSQVQDEYLLANVPEKVQRILFPLLGKVSKRFGLVKASPLERQ